MGKRDAIGVIWWETGSDIDKSIHAVNAVTNTSVMLLPSLGSNGTELSGYGLGRSTSVGVS